MKKFLLFLLLIATPVFAVEPDEMLSDPQLEARAQAIDHQLRCVKCRSEVIASSNADWARDARMLVRELIAEGRTDGEVLDFFVARYGDYVLMRPRFGGSNLLLWLAGPLLLLLGLLAALVFIRRRAAKPRSETGDAMLSEEEKARLEKLLHE